jgi:ribonuclease Z
MAYLHLLGTGAAVSDPHRTTTMLAVENDTGVVAVDCGGDLVQRMLLAGIDIGTLEALIITHGHPDHLSGFPLVMQKLWLFGRTTPLQVIGPRGALAIARSLWEAFGLHHEKGMPEVRWNEISDPGESGTIPLRSWECVYGPATHGPATIGLRFTDPASGGIVAYSSDTAPDPRIAVLARDADILVHEANGSGAGHSSIIDAAGIAKEAGAKRLLLVHVPPEGMIPPGSLHRGRSIFDALEIGEEGRSYRIGEADRSR